MCSFTGVCVCVCFKVPEVRDETVYDSDSESVLNMTSDPVNTNDVAASGKKCLSAIFNEVPVSLIRQQKA